MFVHTGVETSAFGASFRNDGIPQVGDPPDVMDFIIVSIGVLHCDDSFAVGIMDAIANSVDWNGIEKVVIRCKMRCISRKVFRASGIIRPGLAVFRTVSKSVDSQAATCSFGCGRFLVSFVLWRRLLAEGLLSGLCFLPAHLEGVSWDLAVRTPRVGVPRKICWSASALRIVASSALSSTRLASSALSR